MTTGLVVAAFTVVGILLACVAVAFVVELLSKISDLLEAQAAYKQAQAYTIMHHAGLTDEARARDADDA